MNTKTNNIILFSVFSIYLLIGIFIYKDFGIGIEEHFQRKNGFHWLSYLLSFTNFNELTEISNLKYQEIIATNQLPDINFFNFYGILFDVPTALIEILFGINESKDYFEMRHLFSFIVYFISSIFFYKILKNRFGFFIGLIGLLIYILSPRIFGDSFHNNKDVFFLSVFTISIYYCLESIQKNSYKNLILFSLFAAFATSSRIVGLFLPFSIIIFYFFEFLSNTSKYKEFIFKSFFLIFFFFLFLFLHFPYAWTLEFKNILNWLDPFFYYMGLSILFNGEYYLIKFLPRSYLPTWITISTPIYYLLLLFIGSAYLVFRLFRRLSEVKENAIHNDLWRGTKEKKDAYMIIFFLTFIFFVVFFDVALLSGWRHFYFLHTFIVYICAFGLYFLYVLILKYKKIKSFFIPISILPLFFIVFKIYQFHPYQSLYFNNLINSHNVEKYQVDTASLSRADALKNILSQENNNTVINVANASWTPFFNGKALLKEDYKKRLNFVGQEYNKADYIYTNYIYEVDIRYNNKYKIPENFKEFDKLIIDEIPIYTIYKRIN